MKIRILFDVDFYQEVKHSSDWLDADDNDRKLLLKKGIQEYMEDNMDNIIDDIVSTIKYTG